MAGCWQRRVCEGARYVGLHWETRWLDEGLAWIDRVWDRNNGNVLIEYRRGVARDKRGNRIGKWHERFCRVNRVGFDWNRNTRYWIYKRFDWIIWVGFDRCGLTCDWVYDPYRWDIPWHKRYPRVERVIRVGFDRNRNTRYLIFHRLGRINRVWYDGGRNAARVWNPNRWDIPWQERRPRLERNGRDRQTGRMALDWERLGFKRQTGRKALGGDRLGWVR